jgi:hypothetical protein
MDTFTWLFIGHLLGDWLLQNDWMAKGKKRGLLTLPSTVHVTIYTIAIVSALFISGFKAKPLAFYLSLSLVIFVSHWLIDATDGVERWMRFYRQSELEIVRVMVDQTLHLLVLVLLTRFY